jgi:hypothetical protein
LSSPAKKVGWSKNGKKLGRPKKVQTLSVAASNPCRKNNATMSSSGGSGTNAKTKTKAKAKAKAKTGAGAAGAAGAGAGAGAIGGAGIGGGKGGSSYWGVSWHNSMSKWRVAVRIGGSQKHVGYFKDQLEVGTMVVEGNLCFFFFFNFFLALAHSQYA